MGGKLFDRYVAAIPLEKKRSVDFLVALNAQVQRACGALLAVRAGGVHGVGQSPGAQQRGAQLGEGAAHHVVDCRRVRATAGRQTRRS